VIYKQLFGVDFGVAKMKTEDLPVYLTSGRLFFILSYSETKFILIEVSKKEKFGVIALKKQAMTISEKYNLPVAFCFENISRSQRDSLLEKNIPFISESGQLYLPFLGMALKSKFVNSKVVKKEKMMPVTQALFLHLLYNSSGKTVLKKDAAEFLRVTRTSITRASDQLSVMGLITQEMHGKECHISTTEQGLRLFEIAKPHLINPIMRTVNIESDNKFNTIPLSGESALATVSMLNYPKIPTRAAYKDEIDINDIQEIDVRWNQKNNVIQLELWKYDPGLFEKHGAVDPVSLYMCYENNVDERIEGALQEYLEEYKW